MTDEFDLEKFVELFDVAMTSDNPTVRKAFKNLMIVAALVDSDNETKMPGPLSKLLLDVSELKSKMIIMERSKNTTYGPVTTQGAGGGTYNWPYSNMTNTTPISSPNTVTWTVPTTYSTTSINQWDTLYTALSSEQDE